jgi:hypothetical protein
MATRYYGQGILAMAAYQKESIANPLHTWSMALTYLPRDREDILTLSSIKRGGVNQYQAIPERSGCHRSGAVGVSG